ncbi:Gfo/Idh/MocA family protein [Chelativorans salis]|uniref:Gfo/Idh/MocA family oxidoreductase n=1 Tax=Chelativorans salis TaxID=2978478 RepID=A0ABT2LRW6_9HYPH|nr:Gfo/Idh/MocA family oxidoreductase [Chelativorans sp. EGI FJ00035]MCT7377116.1 Gfo/Idh/MocA family oxidoreductase [Chelativorans sp. EGI FJ00035]
MKLRAVLAGCGGMAKGWLRAVEEAPALRDRIEIAGLVDVDEDAARALAEEFGLLAATGCNLPAMLEATSADLLFDVVPPSVRRPVVLSGLEHGCHVLSEKPMATSIEDARFLISAAERAERLHAVVQNRRFISGVRRIRAFLESRALGELTGLHCDFFLAPHFGGFREEMDHPLLLDMAIHTFDAARFMAGKVPLAVYALETNPTGSWYAQGAAASAIFEFSDNVTFTYRGSWCADGAPTSWEAAWRFIGTKGSLIWDGAESFEARVVASEGKFLNDLTPVEVPKASEMEKTHGHASVIAEFLAAIEEGRRPETDGTDNIKSLAMVFAAIESAATQSRVEIRE